MQGLSNLETINEHIIAFLVIFTKISLIYYKHQLQKKVKKRIF